MKASLEKLVQVGSYIKKSKQCGGRGMPQRLKLLRLLRDCEAGLRDILASRSDLRRFADGIAAEAAELKTELIQDGVIVKSD